MGSDAGIGARARQERSDVILGPRVVLQRVNATRLARGRPRIRWDSRLAVIADDRARRAAAIAPRHPGGLDRAMSGRWVDAGEALAWLYGWRVDPVPLWMASPAHRALLLDPSWTHGGVGIYRSGGDLTISLVVADRRP
jgi:uncharacterized protein YkwD